MTQNNQILNHFKSETSITPLIALGLYGIFRLAARIYELKALGHKITTGLKYDANGKSYAEYSLTSSASL